MASGGREPPLRVLGLLAILAGLGAPAGPQEDADYSRIRIEEQDYGYVLKRALWPFPPGTEKVIFVCWERTPERFRRERTWVRDAVMETWERHSALSFRGWSRCAAHNAGIRIRVSDEGPHVKALGQGLDDLPDGMVLNFTFAKWSPGCRQTVEDCIKTMAVHEFGHAIGFAHEQNRFDAPGECQRRKQGTRGDAELTPYDPDSVMNYCSERRASDGRLSRLDIASVQQLYCPPEQLDCEARP